MACPTCTKPFWWTTLALSSAFTLLLGLAWGAALKESWREQTARWNSQEYYFSLLHSDYQRLTEAADRNVSVVQAQLDDCQQMRKRRRHFRIPTGRVGEHP